MALFVPNAGVAEVRLLTLIESKPVCNSVYAYKEPALINSTTLLALSFWVGLWYRLRIVKRMNTSARFYAHIATRLDVPNGLQVSLNTWGGFGERAGALAPLNAALRVNFVTDEPGKSGKGCNYIPALAKEDLNGSFVLEEARNELELAYNALFARMDIAGWQWVVYSRETAGAVRTEGAYFPVTAAVIPQRKLADMGRRLGGAIEDPL